jgi:tetratricopeptide (TPR) repeat protein
MRHVPSDKYNVAWFKLAECVSRGEKERALGVYRLLAHSFGDEAFAYQLMGDLLLSFDDAQAIAKYQEAADRYTQEERWLESAAVYEHLLTFDPTNVSYRKEVVRLYRQTTLQGKIITNLTQLFQQYLDTDSLDNALQTIEQLEQYLLVQDLAPIRQKLVYAMLTKRIVVPDMVIEQIHRTIDGYFVTNDTKALTQFLTYLEQVGDYYYVEASRYMESDVFKV